MTDRKPNELLMVPLNKIDVVDGFNPRAAVALDAEFVASVKAHGILTPILVQPREGKRGAIRYDLVAGERRFRAAGKVGLKEIPAFARDIDDDGLLPVALIENIHRAGLSPVEEAHAFERAVAGGVKPPALAAALGVSVKTVTGRLQLLQLPVPVQALVGAGTITLAAASELKRFEPFGEAVVAAAAQLVADRDISIEQVAGNPGWTLRRVLQELGAAAPFAALMIKNNAVALSGHNAPVWPDGCGVGAVVAALQGLPDQWDNQTYTYPRQSALQFTQADVDAAKAFGCLVPFGKDSYCVDPVWLADRLLTKVERAVKAWARKKAKAKPVGDEAAAAKEAAKSERAKVIAGQISARERNVSLRHSLLELQAAAPPITTEAVQAVGELLLTYAGDDLGDVWRFVDESAETVKTRKSGDISALTYSRGAGGSPIVKALRKAATPEAAMGILVQALIATRFADKTAARPSDRFGGPRGFAIDGYGAGNRTLIGLVDRVAQPFLPADVRLEVEERLQAAAVEREKEQATLRALYIDEGLPGRVREGGCECPHCGALSLDELVLRAPDGEEPPAFEACSCTDEQIIEAAVACPSCGEPECFASCTAFERPADAVAA